MQLHVIIAFVLIILVVYCSLDLLSAFDSVHQSDSGVVLRVIVFQAYRVKKLSGTFDSISSKTDLGTVNDMNSLPSAFRR